MPKKSSKKVVQPRKKQLKTRLSRISGQVNGVSKMVEENRYCIDILTQIHSIQSALSSVAMMLVDDHTRHCIHNAIAKRGDDGQIEELMQVLKKLAR